MHPCTHNCCGGASRAAMALQWTSYLHAAVRPPHLFPACLGLRSSPAKGMQGLLMQQEMQLAWDCALSLTEHLVIFWEKATLAGQ